MKLPPPEAQAADIVAYVDALQDECIRDPNRAAWDRSKQRWLDLYTGNHFADPLVSSSIAAQRLEPEQLSTASRSPARSICRLVYNRVMNAVLAMLAGQVGNPPRVVFAARESGEPPIYYLNGFVKNPQLDQIAAQAGAMDGRVQEFAQTYPPGHPEIINAAVQAGQSVPLPPELVDQVKLLIDNGKMMAAQARMAGMPAPLGIVPPEALVEITDQTTAQYTGTIYDALWEQSGGIEATSENVLNKKVLGWQPTLFESDRTRIDYGESPITLTNVEGTQIFFDPMTTSFRPPRYVIMKEPVSYEEGVAKYPDLEPVLKDKSDSGTLRSRRGNSDGRLYNMEFARDMCEVRTLWIRDWKYPMDPDEALNCGKVSIQNIPTGTVEPAMDQMGQVVGQRQVTRQAMVLGETGEETAPGAGNWPFVFGIREVRDIEGELVYDRRCKLPVIPVINNPNIPIPFSPYGFGEPDRLDGLQMAINRVLSDLVTHHRYNTYPPEVCHSVVAKGMSAELRKFRLQPGSVIIADSASAQAVGGDLSKLVQFIETPPMSADAWKLLEFLVDAIDKEANNTEVQQGEAPAGTSGAWVANLQAAASTVAQVTSKATEAWLKGLVRLYVNFIANDMTEADAQKYCSKYPPAITAAFRCRQKSLYLDITVEVQSGSAAAKQTQTQGMIAARQAGITVSEPDILERLNIDPDATLKREGEWLQKKVDSGLVAQQAENEQGANNGSNAEGQGNSA